jgi:hypothetical protein
VTSAEVVTDAAPVYLRVVDQLVPAAWHRVERYANNRIEAGHSRLKTPTATHARLTHPANSPERSDPGLHPDLSAPTGELTKQSGDRHSAALFV